MLARCLVPLYVFGKLLSCTTPLYPLLRYSCEKSTCACSMLSTNSHKGPYYCARVVLHARQGALSEEEEPVSRMQ